MSNTNYAALSQFVDFNNIERDASGRCWFTADIIIRASGKGGAETLETRVSFTNGDSDQLVITSGDTLKAGEIPLSYKTRFGTWSHNSGVLTIKGNYNGFAYVTDVCLAS